MLSCGAVDREDAGHPAGLARRRLQRGAVVETAGEHARQRQLAAVLRVHGLEHIGQRILRRSRAEPLGGLGDAGRFMAQRLHQPQHAVLARRRAEQHRTDQAFAQFAGEIVEHVVARRLDILEQLLHQRVVVIGELFQHREAGFLLAVEVAAFERHDFGGLVLAIDEGAFQREVDEARDQVAVPDRNLPQQQRKPRRRLQGRERLADALAGAVDLVEKQEARDAEILEFAQDDLQLRQLLLVRLADHHRGVDRRQRGAHVVREFDRAGAIDEGVAVAHEVGGGGGKADAHLVVAGLGAGVADRGSGIDAAGLGDGAGARQDGFEKCGFTALERAHQRDAPWTRFFSAWRTSDVLSHCRLLVWSSARDWVGRWMRPPVPGFWQAGKTSVRCIVRCTGTRGPTRISRHCGRCNSFSNTRYTSAFSRHERPRFAFRCPSKNEGAGNAGCALHPRSRVQNCAKKTHTSIQGSGEHPTFPAQWLYGLYAFSPAIRICLSPSPRGLKA